MLYVKPGTINLVADMFAQVRRVMRSGALRLCVNSERLV